MQSHRLVVMVKGRGADLPRESHPIGACLGWVWEEKRGVGAETGTDKIPEQLGPSLTLVGDAVWSCGATVASQFLL